MTVSLYNLLGQGLSCGYGRLGPREKLCSLRRFQQGRKDVLSGRTARVPAGGESSTTKRC